MATTQVPDTCLACGRQIEPESLAFFLGKVRVTRTPLYGEYGGDVSQDKLRIKHLPSSKPRGLICCECAWIAFPPAEPPVDLNGHVEVSFSRGTYTDEEFEAWRDERHGKDGFRVLRRVREPGTRVFNWDEQYQFYASLDDAMAAIESRDFEAGRKAF